MRFISLTNLFIFLIISNVFGSDSPKYIEGEAAELVIKLGLLKDKSVEESHTHYVLEYELQTYWCTESNNGEKVCTEF